MRKKRENMERDFLMVVCLILTAIVLSLNLVEAVDFGVGDNVEIYNSGSIGLKVRYPNACSSSYVVKFDGTQGKVLDSPTNCEDYNRWKINWSDGTVGWSAENWLRKSYVTTSCSPNIFPELFIYSSQKNRNLYNAFADISIALKNKNIPLTPELLAAIRATLEKEVGVNFFPVEEYGDYGMGPGCSYKIGGVCKSTPYEGGVDYKGRGYIQLTLKNNYQTYCGSDCIGTSTPESNVCGCKNVDYCAVTSESICPQIKALQPERAGEIFVLYYENKYYSGKNLITYSNEKNYWNVGYLINGGTSYADDFKIKADNYFNLFNTQITKTQNLILCLSGGTSSNNPPNLPSSVNQLKSDGTTVISEGGATPESTVMFKGTVSDPDGDNVRLEVELRQITEAFTGEPTPETISNFVPSGTQVTLTRYGLVNANYKWQYRAKDINGNTSAWKEFGTAGNTDFVVSVSQCNSGLCCDIPTGTFRDSAYKCQEDATTDYGCPSGTSCGSVVGVRHQDRYCSGFSGQCDGELVWDSWAITDSCGSAEVCVDDTPTCQFNSQCGIQQNNTGWKSPTSTGRIYNDWYNPTYAFSSDNQRAWRDSSKGYPLFATQDYYNFGFNIPGNAIINGIEVQVEGYCTSSDNNNIRVHFIDHSGNEKSIQFGTSEEIRTYGGPSDLWGVSWTANDFSDGNFGIYLLAYASDSSAKNYIDSISAKVYYTPLPPQCTSGLCCDISAQKFKAQGSQPSGYVDDTNGLCSGSSISETTCINSATGTCYILIKDYYCNGNDSNAYVSYALKDTCGTCKYCSDNKLSCDNYNPLTTCSSLFDCDYLNGYFIEGIQSPITVSYCKYKDYEDSYRYCSGTGSCSALGCNVHSDLVQATAGICKYIEGCSGGGAGTVSNYLKGTSCDSGKECDGNGNCVKKTEKINISLNSRWNLISIPLVLENNSVESVFGDIMDKVIVVNSFDNGALTYDPKLPEFSDLHNIDYLHGYWVKMNESANLMVIREKPLDKIITLEKNWNLISYMCNEPKNVSDVFSSVMDKVIVVNGFENGALTYDPKLPDFSDLQEMKPNYGYWVKMNESDVLDYGRVC